MERHSGSNHGHQTERFATFDQGHGASPTTAMTHIAIQEKLDGKAVEWMEHVSAAQYQG